MMQPIQTNNDYFFCTNNFLKIIGILFLPILLMIMSCEGNNLLPITHAVNIDSVYIEGRLQNGMLSFSSKKAYREYTDKLKSMSLEEVRERNRAKGFISYQDLKMFTKDDYSVYKDKISLYTQRQEDLIEGDDKVAGQYLDIPDLYFTSTLSVNKEIRIGDTIFKIERNNIFGYANGHRDEIEKYKDNENYAQEYLTVYPVVSNNAEDHTVTHRASLRSRQVDKWIIANLVNQGNNSNARYIHTGGFSIFGTGWETVGTGWEEFLFLRDGHYRFQLEKWWVNVPFYASTGAKGMLQRSRFWYEQFLFWRVKHWRDDLYDGVQYMNIEGDMGYSDGQYNTYSKKITLTNVSSDCAVSEFFVENAIIKGMTQTTQCLKGTNNYVIGIGFRHTGPFHFNFNLANIAYLQNPISSSIGIIAPNNASLLLDFSNITITKAWAEVKNGKGEWMRPKRNHSLSLK